MVAHESDQEEKRGQMPNDVSKQPAALYESQVSLEKRQKPKERQREDKWGWMWGSGAQRLEVEALSEQQTWPVLKTEKDQFEASV